MAHLFLETMKRLARRWMMPEEKRKLRDHRRRRLVCEPLEDRRLLSIDLASATALGVSGNGDSVGADISADGRYVAFASGATNLVAGDSNAATDVFVKDLQTGGIVRVSTNSSGVEGNGGSDSPSVSADGQYVAFASSATNLVAGGTSGRQIFVKNLTSGATTLVSTNSAGSYCDTPSISSDGTWVAFVSVATGTRQVYAKHLSGLGETKLVSADGSGNQGNNTSNGPRISTGGQYVAFSSYSSNLVTGDSNGTEDVFRKDLQSGGIVRVSTDSSGAQGNGISESPSISSDGRYVAFWSEASNLIASDANGALRDIFVKDVQTGSTRIVNTDSSGKQPVGVLSDHPDISGDGRFVAFESFSDKLVPGDTNQRTDVFVKDLKTGTTTRVSLNGSGKQANNECTNAAISGDGRFVAFESIATNLHPGDTTAWSDVFRVSHAIPGVPTVGDVSRKEGNSSTTKFTFTVTLSTPVAQAVTVNYATQDGTATAGSDYTSLNGTLIFNPGETKKTITVAVIGDKTYENQETFTLRLSDPDTSEVVAQATGTILNDDKLPTLSINSVSLAEGNAGTTAFAFDVTLAGATALPVTVQYSTTDGTAQAGSDYAPLNDTLTFAPGETKKAITVLVNGDATFELNEAFTVNLSNAVGATIARGKGTGRGTVQNDDAMPTVTIGDGSLVETPTGFVAQFAISLSDASGVPATVKYGTVNGTAKSGQDFKNTTATLVFPAGQTVGIIAIPILGDPASKTGKTFFVKLSNPKQTTLGSQIQGTFTFPLLP
jgi:Tol biopolymer transport system component